jgi:CheY-like chemotaxis protein
VSGLRLLAVEDQPVNVALLRALLGRSPHPELREAELSVARTLAEGRRLISGGGFDVVLLDIRLPDMEGWDILERLTEKGRFPALPVVMVSAHSTPSTAERAIREGVRAYVTKPFTSDELFEAIARAVPEAS